MRFTVSLAKPAFGKPCNGCGFCCLHVTCELGQVFTPQGVRCLALTAAPGGSFSCGLLATPRAWPPLPPQPGQPRSFYRQVKLLHDSPLPVDMLASLYARLLGAGAGCDSQTSLEWEDCRRSRLRKKPRR